MMQGDIDAAVESEQLAADETYDGVVEACQGQVLEAVALVPVNERYWTGPTCSTARARDLAWSGTAHTLVAELGRHPQPRCSLHSESPHWSPESAWSAM
jgi:hypothetical protein